jgi:hypothetical protein
VTIGSSDASVVAPATLNIPEGSTQAGIRVRSTAAVGAATITATLGSSSDTTLATIGVGIAPTLGSIVINEILGEVPTTNGDANCNGSTDAVSDEFMEITNVSTSALAMSGVSLWDVNAMTSGTPRYSFGTFTLGPGETVVVFGGSIGTTGSSVWCTNLDGAHIGDARVFTTGASGFGFNNAGDTAYITTTTSAASVVLDSIAYVAATTDGEAYARSPEGSGAFTAFRAITDRATDRLWSPGTLNSGRYFALATAP